MSVRPVALKWFLSNYGTVKNKVYVSKYYTTVESWPKTNVWWLQVPMTAIDKDLHDCVNLLCQVKPNAEIFYYLKVPTKYLRQHLDKFHKMGENKISLYLSAEKKEKLFIEERGEGNLDFSKFLMA